MSAPFLHPYRTAPDTLAAIRADLDDMLGRIALVEAESDSSVTPEAVEVLAREGRELFTRRALERAVDHAAAMLPALGLPQLVGPDFAPLDPEAAGDALDVAVAALDALDEDPDAEPWLGWTGAAIGAAVMGDTLDHEAEPEHDEEDGTGEPCLASPERHPRVPSVSWGRVYTARGGDESQIRWAEGARHDGEAVNEDGTDLDDGELDDSDREPTLGRPEDYTAKDTKSGAGFDEMEDDGLDDDRDPEPIAWVFGPSRREAAHA